MIDIKGKSVPLVDFHTHIGKVSIETTKGKSQRVNNPKDIIDLYEKLQFELFKRFSSRSDDFYITVPDSADQLAVPLHPLAKLLLENKYPGKVQGWLVDHVITFPFNDIFHLKTKPKFVRSNDFVRKTDQKYDNTFRFIPFCRVDPTDGDSASKEVERSVRLGSRGLKLHPMSQGWIDKIISIETSNVLKTAGSLGLPVIFDVPNKSVARDITEISVKARTEIAGAYPLNVVLGHTGFDYSSPSIFENLQKEQMFCETSGMRGKDVELFFKNVMTVDNWFTKILYGSDHNYFSVLQAADFITFLFSHRFVELLAEFDQDIEPLDAASLILGGNALKIIPPAWNNRENRSASLNYTSDLKALNEVIRNAIIKESIGVTIQSMTSQVDASVLTDTLVFHRENTFAAFEPIQQSNGDYSFIPAKLSADTVSSGPGRIVTDDFDTTGSGKLSLDLIVDVLADK
ncbi:MAG: amidohydrolase family protein [Candidatus Hodarchaeales archaeon]